MYNYSSLLLYKVKQHLKSGGIIAYPTESCYGFGCDPFNYKAINKIIQLKGRSKTKGLIVIAGDRKQLNGLIQPIPAVKEDIIAKYWPGFYSLILPTTDKVPRNLIGRHHKIAVRVTKHKQVQQLCKFLDMPLVSTSANKAGFKAVKTYRDCMRQFGDKVLVLPGITNFAKKPSTIIDLENNRILRS